MGGESVRVAVRVRPFNTREKDRNATLIIGMNGAATSITNPESKEAKTFTFDFSYWSHDGFREDEAGYLHPDGDKYADQKKVMSELGQDVMDNAFKGFNCSLFAYGQTGSGKSYSMVGYGENKGIVPQTCDAIFKYIDNETSDTKKFRVAVSMLEIYNEQVRDLFSKDNPKGGLKVRQHPKLGVQVVGLQEIAVNSYKDIDQRVQQGTANRTVASTQMNATSSRAHTVVAISFTQVVKDGKGPGKDAEQSAKINLVDLAGSERAESTGATGDRLKEGSAINLSLTMLGNVITALAEKSNNPKKKVLVPYRDSKLTMILQDALGGNSKTIMIAALSPADINYEETLSTLRYADRAKKIKNNAVVNVDPTEALINKLKEENAKLLKQLQAMGGGELPPDMDGDGGGGMSDEDKAALRAQIEAELKAQMAENMDMLQNADMNWDERLARDQERFGAMDAEAAAKLQKQSSTPHLVNLNEDAALSNVIFHFIEGDETTIGRKDPKANSMPDIPLSGLSIKTEHAVIRKEEEGFVIEAKKNIKDTCKVFLNGVQMEADKPLPLKHNDRLLFGNNHMYIFVDPEVKKKAKEEWKALDDEEAEKPPELHEWDWEQAQAELARARGVDISGKVDMSHMTASERRQQQLQDQLLSVLPLLNEANDIAYELEKGVQFETLLLSRYSQGELRTEINIKMKAVDGNTFWIWDMEKFVNRVYLMREMYNNLLEYGDEYADAEVKPEDDPFYDPKQKVLIGHAQVLFASVVHMVEQDLLVTIKGSSKNSEGSLQVAITPVKPNGAPIEDDDEEFEVDDPSELLGRRLDFRIKIPYARGLSPNYLKDVHCQFKLDFLSNEVEYTKSITGTINPEFNYDKQFTIPSVDQNILDFFQNEMLNIEVWGESQEEIVHSGRRRGSVTGVRTPSRPGTPDQARRRSSIHMQGMGDLQLKKHLEEVSREYEEKAKVAQDQVNFLKEETQIQSQKLDKKDEQLSIQAAQLSLVQQAVETGEVCTEISQRVVKQIRSILAATDKSHLPANLEIIDVSNSTDPAVVAQMNDGGAPPPPAAEPAQAKPVAKAPAEAPPSGDSPGNDGVVVGDGGGAKSGGGGGDSEKPPESKACIIL